jgi:hypothetical protein
MEYDLDTPQIAVIIATKNRANLLKIRAIASVQKQSRQPNYLIVVDDSLPQVQRQNRLVVESLTPTDYAIKYMTNERTLGASGAWNTAIEYLIKESSGKKDSLFLAFLDDDDEWHQNYLERCIVAARENLCNMVATGFNRYESDNQLPIACLPPESLDEDLFLSGNPNIQGSNLFLSLEIMLMAGGFDEQLLSSTDRDLCIRISELKALRYFHISKPLLNHYADSYRLRLSTPNSYAKESGLKMFWQKYQGRMTDKQQTIFLQRTQRLFNWQPESLVQPPLKLVAQTLLTFGIELGNIDLLHVGDIITKIHSLSPEYLMGFNLVLAAKSDVSTNEINALVELVSGLGVNCYNLCGQIINIDAATALIAKENIGHSGWILKDCETGNRQPINNECDVLSLLKEVGARALPITTVSVTYNEQHENQEKVLRREIKKCRITAACNSINNTFGQRYLTLLGTGSESIVMTDGQRVFKRIDYWKSRAPAEQIKFLQKRGPQWGGLPGLYSLDEVVCDGTTLLIAYEYEESKKYRGGSCKQMIDLLHSCSQAGIVCNNLHPKNLIKVQKQVKLIDYGADIKPWNELGFEHMARRAYLTVYFAEHPQLSELMRQSLSSINIPEMDGYKEFRQKLLGVDRDIQQSKLALLPLRAPTDEPEPYSLVIGVITGDANKVLPLLHSIAELDDCDYLTDIYTFILCNGCSVSSINKMIAQTNLPVGNLKIISESQQKSDAIGGLFGPDLQIRKAGQLGIAQSRSMLQKYVGLECASKPNSIAWVLDDDMRVDARAQQYLAWLPSYRKLGVDVVIGQYEGASPNPPINGIRGQLVDLLHNLRWLDTLSNATRLPNRQEENAALREIYPDYYYDLSRVHTAHLESTFWLEPAYDGETVAEARIRLFKQAPLLLSGYPLTRSIVPQCPIEPMAAAKDSLNRGGNTFIINHKALLNAHNHTPKIQGRELRRSDMMWSMINKHYYGLTIKTAPFPVKHIGRVLDKPVVCFDKVQDEIMGSAIYAALQEFLIEKPFHKLDFTDVEKGTVWHATEKARNIRLVRLRQSFYRISGLAQSFSNYPELDEFARYLLASFTPAAMDKLEVNVNEMKKSHIDEFLQQIVPQSIRFAESSF